MDVVAIQGNHERLLATGVDAAQMDDLREWFCYIKPLGEDMIVVAHSESNEDPVFRVHVSGTSVKTT